MELDYKNYIVRIVHNPNDIILRFTEKDTLRNWEVTLTERDFVEYQILGGLEFVLSLLKNVLQKNKDLDIKTSSKQLSFTIQYQPDDHCKKLSLEFILPAIKKVSASVDLDDLNRRMATLEKYIRIQESNIVTLQKEVEIQKDKTSGHIIIPGCRSAIADDILELYLGVNGTIDPITGTSYNSSTYTPFPFNACNSLKNLTNLSFLQKCHSLRLVFPQATDYSAIGKMTSLKNLSIINPVSTTQMNINWITTLVNLETALFFGCKELTDISPLTKLLKIKTIDIRNSGVQNTSMLGSHIQITK